MAVSVALEFIPPDEPDLKALHVYESATKTGTFVEIDNTQVIGAYPKWISRYTTANATSIYDWFAIAWQNQAGVLGALSAPMQGGSTTLVSEIVNRVMIRDPNLNQIIVGQEAEAAISEYYGVTDPYTVALSTVPPNVMSGLTLFTMARCYIVQAAVGTSTGTAHKWTAGIVSLDSSASSGMSPWDSVQKLLEMANKELGRNYDLVLLLKEIEVAGGYKELVSIDLSRAIYELQ